MRGDELAERAQKSKEWGRPYVDQLVAMGLVRRSEDEEALRLTEEGQRAVTRLVGCSREGLRRLVADWGEDPQLERMVDQVAPELLGARGDRPPP
ncbi:hypothetical protein GCM10009734_49950 [Nonomuraea bangladeshensis]